MGTRGFITFVADGVEKTAYNHFDSYPSGLGLDVLTWLRGAVGDLAEVKRRAVALRVLGEDAPKPTAEDVERLGKYANTNVSSQKIDDWYELLRETRGDPAAMLDAGVIEDASEFPADSLFAEWGYVVDLDAEVFEVYRGFQQFPHKKGRFADREPADRPYSSVSAYCPVALAASWPLTELPTDDTLLAVDGDE